MNRAQSFMTINNAWSVHAVTVAEVSCAPWLVEGNPRINFLAENARHNSHILGELICDLAVCPTAAVFQILWQIPVVERNESLNACGVKRVNQAFIICDALRVYLTINVWDNARPRDGEAVRTHTQLLHNLNIFRVAVVLIASHRTVRLIDNSSFAKAQRIPNGRRATALSSSTFYLERCGCGAPNKILWE